MLQSARQKPEKAYDGTNNNKKNVWGTHLLGRNT